MTKYLLVWGNAVTHSGLFAGTGLDKQGSAVFGMMFGEMDSFLSLL